MSETKRDCEIGYSKLPRGRPFQKRQSRNPHRPRPRNFPALLVDARKITKREAVVTQLVNKSTPPPEPAPFTAADEEMMGTSSCGNPGRWNSSREARSYGPHNPLPLNRAPLARELGCVRQGHSGERPGDRTSRTAPVTLTRPPHTVRRRPKPFPLPSGRCSKPSQPVPCGLASELCP